jgi:hypothetical protein
MDLLTFVAECVKALAWPGSVLVIVLILRRPLTQLLPLLQRIKWKDFEAEFGEGLQEAKNSVQVVLAPEDTRLLPAPEEQGRLAKLAELSPRAAILEAWTTLEAEAIQYARTHYEVGGLPPSMELPHAMRTLQEASAFPVPLRQVFRDLRALRNQAAHAPEFSLSAADAIEFVGLVGRLIAHLRGERGT